MYQQRLVSAIPGGAHTYSRGYDQFPSNSPQILSRGKGAYVYDTHGRSYLDYGMALRSVNIGYAEDEINNAVIKEIQNGNNLTRPSMIELEAAELLIDLIDAADMVKFTKNGSTSVTAAVKLSRAYTGRDIVVRCADHPFFSYDDWFIGSTSLTRGIPHQSMELTKVFSYNDLNSLQSIVDQYHDQIACVVMEPETVQQPELGFLLGVQEICKKNNIVFILDEMITGFRWHIKGAQHLYELRPDLSTFGKAMANGFSVSCVAGRREIMELGSIELEGRERVFLLSTTHGAEMSSLGAFVASVKLMQRDNVIKHLSSYGDALKKIISQKAREHDVADSLKIGGRACSPWYVTEDLEGRNSMQLRTLFMQEMIKNGVMIPWIALSMRHSDEELRLTSEALDKSLPIYRMALNEGVDKYLAGSVIKPVFRSNNLNIK